VFGHDIRHQVPLTSPIHSSYNDGLPHTGVLAEGDLDFLQLNAEASDLDLVILPAKKLEIAIRQIPHEIASLVQTPSWRSTPGVRQESLGGQCRMVMITTGQAITTNVQLAWQANGHEL
jgi:hypothetical protein